MPTPSRKAAAFTAVLYRLMKMRCNVGQQHRTLSAAVAFPRLLSCVCVCAQSPGRVHLFRSFPARHRCAAQLAAITGRAAGRPQRRRRRRRHSRRFRSRWFRPEESSGVRVVAGGSLALRVLPSPPRARGPQAGAIWRPALLWIIPAAVEASIIASQAAPSEKTRHCQVCLPGV